MTAEEMAARIQDGEKELILPLWEKMEPLAKSMARRRVRGEWRCEYEDLLQAAFLGLIDAVRRYGRNSASSFSSVFYNSARDAFTHAMNLNRKRHDTISLEGVADDGDRNQLERLEGPDMIRELEDSIYKEQLRAALEQALEGLSSRQAQVIRARFLHGLSRAKAAEQLGVNVSSIDRTAGRALEQLRRSPVLLHFLQNNSRNQGA